MNELRVDMNISAVEHVIRTLHQIQLNSLVPSNFVRNLPYIDSYNSNLCNPKTLLIGTNPMIR